MLATSLRGLVLTALALMISATASAAESHACAGVVDPVERLACYDAAFPPSADARIGAESLEARRAKALQEFGLSGVQKQAREPDQVRDARPDRIEAAIKSVYSSATGERIVSLDNGQLWMLTEASTKGYLRVGDAIVIRTAAMGSFMLVTPSHIALRAKRIQ